MVIAPVTFNSQDAVQIIIRDVTERIQAEQLRRESEGLRVALEKEQELGELKTKLMTTLSHELRTPLTIIQSSSEFLDRFHERLSAEQRKERLHNIQGQVQKLTTLAEDVSFLIREQIDQVNARFVTTDLEQLCQVIIGEMAFFGESPRKLDLQLDGHLKNVQVDPRLIHRILSNLLSNAIKYSSESSEIALRLRKEDNTIIIQVIDNGIGIPEQDQERLFEIFHRGSNVGHVSGTGIGLAIVKEAVTLHKGTITVESTEGVGTTFTIRLPLWNGESSSD
jgi:signal transduction histidine kinase